jgi:curli biogenesis system outer membrane secretion channel CsgG
MKKGALLVFVATLFLLSSLTINAEEASALKDALRFSINELNVKLDEGKIIAVLNFKSEYKTVSEYIAEELTRHIVDDGVFKVVERQNLDALQKEMDFQLSGEVSDQTTLSIGRKLGAEIIISGSFSAFGGQYRLNVRATSVETAEILAIQTKRCAGTQCLIL